MPDFAIHPDTALGAAHLVVADMERALRFYTAQLGLQRLPDRADEAVLGAGGAALLVLAKLPGARPKPWHAAGLYHVALRLPGRLELARALQHLVATRFPLQGVADHLVCESIYLADPDGNGLELCADRPRDKWPRRNGHVQMGTLALELDELLAVAERDGRPWMGMPAGTRVGHVHLQVGDLRRAAAFYRGLLGLDLTSRLGDGALFFSAGGYHHHVATNIWAGRGAPPAPADAAGLRCLSVVLPNREELQRLAARVRESGTAWEEGPAGLLLHDPAGNGVLLTAAGV